MYVFSFLFLHFINFLFVHISVSKNLALKFLVTFQLNLKCHLRLVNRFKLFHFGIF